MQNFSSTLFATGVLINMPHNMCHVPQNIGHVTQNREHVPRKHVAHATKSCSTSHKNMGLVIKRSSSLNTRLSIGKSGYPSGSADLVSVCHCNFTREKLCTDLITARATWKHLPKCAPGKAQIKTPVCTCCTETTG